MQLGLISQGKLQIGATIRVGTGVHHQTCPVESQKGGRYSTHSYPDGEEGKGIRTGGRKVIPASAYSLGRLAGILSGNQFGWSILLQERNSVVRRVNLKFLATPPKLVV
jgi:hypothetical protein